MRGVGLVALPLWLLLMLLVGLAAYVYWRRS